MGTMRGAPVEIVKAGVVSIPIYFLKSRGTYCAKWTEGGVLRERKNKDLPTLRALVKESAKSLSGRKIDVSSLTKAQLAAVEEVLRQGITAEELQTFQRVEDCLLSEVIDNFLEDKTGISVCYQKSLQCSLGQLARRFKGRTINSITPVELDEWLRVSNKNIVTRNNKRARFVSLWKWARDKGIVPDIGRTVADRVTRDSIRELRRRHKTETWAPDELRTILAHVPDRYLPWVVFSAFAGIRTMEIYGLTKKDQSRKALLSWDDVHLTGAHPRIVVPSPVAKTAQRRVIPICPALLEWILTLPNRSGLIGNTVGPWEMFHRERGICLSAIGILSSAVGGPWKKNALRHSFGTYRVLQSNSLGETALEMGNSESMIRNHYLDIGRTQKEATDWFSIRPSEIDRCQAMAG